MTNIPVVGMNTFYAMRRANGDWFAVDDNGQTRMPIFRSSNAAMIARSRDSGMECFRPVAFDALALDELRKTESDSGSFLMVADPSRKVKHGLRLGSTELLALMTQRTDPSSENIHRNTTR
jgi:hypothetical protein